MEKLLDTEVLTEFPTLAQQLIIEIITLNYQAGWINHTPKHKIFITMNQIIIIVTLLNHEHNHLITAEMKIVADVNFQKMSNILTQFLNENKQTTTCLIQKLQKCVSLLNNYWIITSMFNLRFKPRHTR